MTLTSVNSLLIRTFCLFLKLITEFFKENIALKAVGYFYFILTFFSFFLNIIIFVIV